MSTPKKSNGQFAKGTSGNPAGRPAGSRNKSTLLFEALLEGEGERLIRKAISLALAGDVRALALCLERLAPPPRDRLVQFELPLAHNLKDIALGVEHILKAISAGQITPQEGELLSRIVAEHAKLIHSREVDERLARLERAAWFLDNAPVPDHSLFPDRQPEGQNSESPSRQPPEPGRAA